MNCSRLLVFFFKRHDLHQNRWDFCLSYTINQHKINKKGSMKTVPNHMNWWSETDMNSSKVVASINLMKLFFFLQHTGHLYWLRTQFNFSKSPLEPYHSEGRRPFFALHTTGTGHCSLKLFFIDFSWRVKIWQTTELMIALLLFHLLMNVCNSTEVTWMTIDPDSS